MLQESTLLGSSLIRADEKLAARTFPVGPPDQDSIMIAAMLRAQCPNDGNGSTFVFSPESTVPVRHTVRRLARALEVLTGESILTMEFSFGGSGDRPSDALENSFVTHIAPRQGGLSAEALLAYQGGQRQAVTARVDASQNELLSIVSSGEFSRFLLSLKTRFRYVLIEGRSLRNSPETVLLAKSSDGVILTVEQGTTEIADVATTQKLARLSGIRLLGFVFEKNPKAARRAL